jgi:hypothetical protein
MEKHTNGLLALLAVLFLGMGFLFGGLYGSNDTETIIEVPGETVTEYVNVNVSVPSESPDFLGDAIAFFWDEIEDEDLLLRCDGYEYDFDDIEISKIYDEYSLTMDEDELTVEFKAKLVYDEEDSRSCRNTVEVEVFYEDDEDTELTLHR